MVTFHRRCYSVNLLMQYDRPADRRGIVDVVPYLDGCVLCSLSPPTRIILLTGGWHDLAVNVFNCVPPDVFDDDSIASYDVILTIRRQPVFCVADDVLFCNPLFAGYALTITIAMHTAIFSRHSEHS